MCSAWLSRSSIVACFKSFDAMTEGTSLSASFSPVGGGSPSYNAFIHSFLCVLNRAPLSNYACKKIISTTGFLEELERALAKKKSGLLKRCRVLSA